ncbi:MAG: hypothetical protein AAGH99_03695 [Planctomycetota bacterium]
MNQTPDKSERSATTAPETGWLKIIASIFGALVALVGLPSAVFGTSVIEMFSDIKTVNYTIAINASYAGIAGYLLGALGHLFGRVSQYITLASTTKKSCPSCAENPQSFISCFSRGLNDFFRTSFWIYGIVFALLYILGERVDSYARVHALAWSLMGGLINAVFFPRLNVIFYKDASGDSTRNYFSGSIGWFAAAGMIFGITVALTAAFVGAFTGMQLHAVAGAIVVSGLFCFCYGLMLGAVSWCIGGFGPGDINQDSDGLFGAALTLIAFIPIVIVLAVLLGRDGELGVFFFSVIALTNIAMFVGAIVFTLCGRANLLPRKYYLFRDFVRLDTNKSAIPIAKFIFVVFSSLPWGVCAMLGISLFR